MRYAVFLIVLFSSLVRSQEVKVSSGWYKVMKVSDIYGAGNDYPEYVESRRKETKLHIKAFPKSKQKDLYGSFSVFVHQEPVNWHASLELSVRRTSKGKGKKGGMHGGDNWHQIHRFSSRFFKLVGKKDGVDLQYRIKGLSVLLPVDTYTTEIVFTVLNL